MGKRTLATLREGQPGYPEGGHLSEEPVRTRYLLCSVWWTWVFRISLTNLGTSAVTGEQVFLLQQEFWAACCHSPELAAPQISPPSLPSILFAVAARLLAVLHCPKGDPVSHLLFLLFLLCDALTPDSCVVSSLPSLKSELTNSSHQGVSTAQVERLSLLIPAVKARF